MGVSPEQAVKSLANWGASAFGGNCGTGPDELLKVIGSMRTLAPGAPLIFKPNAGVPVLADGKTVYSATPDSMANSARQAVEAGARIIGACCGSTPDHIRAMRDEIVR